MHPTQTSDVSPSSRHIAVLGAGVAGVRCAALLQAQGHQVTVIDKSRGVGGRLSTRRVEVAGADGRPEWLSFDHGTASFSARSAAFLTWCQEAEQLGWVRRWSPCLAAGSRAFSDAQWVAAPDMPELCRRQLHGVQVLTSRQVRGLARTCGRWQLQLTDGPPLAGFDAVVLAIPPAQAADLLQSQRWDWTLQARAIPMQACWTLLGVSQGPPPTDWDAARPTAGPLAWAAVNHLKPGRQVPTSGTPWVVQATPAWSQAHLEAPPAEVMVALQQALEALPGVGPLQWPWATTHRWRYATTPLGDLPPAPWWDRRLGLGVCGDWLGGGGVQGGWQSGQALAEAMAGALPPLPELETGERGPAALTKP